MRQAGRHGLPSLRIQVAGRPSISARARGDTPEPPWWRDTVQTGAFRCPARAAPAARAYSADPGAMRRLFAGAARKFRNGAGRWLELEDPEKVGFLVTPIGPGVGSGEAGLPTSDPAGPSVGRNRASVGAVRLRPVPSAAARCRGPSSNALTRRGAECYAGSMPHRCDRSPSRSPAGRPPAARRRPRLDHRHEALRGPAQVPVAAPHEGHRHAAPQRGGVDDLERAQAQLLLHAALDEERDPEPGLDEALLRGEAV